MKIIDAHMHYYDIDKFYDVAENAGHANTAACWQQICRDNSIVLPLRWEIRKMLPAVMAAVRRV